MKALAVLAGLGLLLISCGSGSETSSETGEGWVQSSDTQEPDQPGGQAETAGDSRPETFGDLLEAMTPEEREEFEAELEEQMLEIAEDPQTFERNFQVGVWAGIMQLDLTDEAMTCIDESGVLTIELDPADEQNVGLVALITCAAEEIAKGSSARYVAEGVDQQTADDLACISGEVYSYLGEKSLEDRFAFFRQDDAQWQEEEAEARAVVTERASTGCGLTPEEFRSLAERP